MFYSWWDWRFLLLIFLSSGFDFLAGIFINKTSNKIKRKWILFLSLIVNIGFLGIFKYYDFFVSNFIEAFSFLAENLMCTLLILSYLSELVFHTFQSLSYTIDVFRLKLKPTTDIVAFFSYILIFSATCRWTN